MIAVTQSLPASPISGQEIMLVDSLTSPTFKWHFIYDGRNAVWRYIGGGGLGTNLPGIVSGANYHGVQFTLIDAISTVVFRWTFAYNANSSSAYKWEFIGGTPGGGQVNASEGFSTGGSAWVDLATFGPDFTIPRAGDYLAVWGARIGFSTSVATAQVGIALGAGGTPASDLFLQVGNPAAVAVSVEPEGSCSGQFSTNLQAVAAGTLFRMRYWYNVAAANSFANRRMLVSPIRVA